jgi:hypothetical protein
MRRQEHDEAIVVSLDPRRRRSTRPLPLTDSEIERMRLMLEQFDRLATGCPIARRTLSGAS